MKKQLLVYAILLTLTIPVSAATKTAKLSVPTMNCPVCPITVKKVLLKVPGVSEAKVDFAKREVVVIFDDTLTNTEALTSSTKESGYPSLLQGAEQ